MHCHAQKGSNRLSHPAGRSPSNRLPLAAGCKEDGDTQRDALCMGRKQAGREAVRPSLRNPRWNAHLNPFWH
jgi:hypothetical protein